MGDKLPEFGETFQASVDVFGTHSTGFSNSVAAFGGHTESFAQAVSSFGKALELMPESITLDVNGSATVEVNLNGMDAVAGMDERAREIATEVAGEMVDTAIRRLRENGFGIA